MYGNVALHNVCSGGCFVTSWRLDDQCEVIEQTLLSVQASVSRLQVAPTALTAPDVEEVKRVVGEITHQTRAVEDAVQQVMAIRG